MKMPPKVKRENDGSGPRPKRRRMPDKGTEEYYKRRERNNEAVKKSRDKTRGKAKDTIERVNELKDENVKLEQQVSILSKELGVLRDLFSMAHTGGPSTTCPGTEAGIQTDAIEDAEPVASPVNHSALQKDHEYSLSPRPALKDES